MTTAKTVAKISVVRNTAGGKKTPIHRSLLSSGSDRAGTGKRNLLRADDGNEFRAFSATSDAPHAFGVVILVRRSRLHWFY